MKAPALTVALSLALGALQDPVPAALPVGVDCAARAATHTLIRNDVLAKMDAAEVNLPKCEDALRQAQTDLQALKSAVDELQRQKALLQEHVKLLEKVIQAQPAPQTTPNDVAAAIEGAWEWADAPLAFVAGTGMCVGVAWGLTQATR
jgi:hypothetical protein